MPLPGTALGGGGGSGGIIDDRLGGHDTAPTAADDDKIRITQRGLQIVDRTIEHGQPPSATTTSPFTAGNYIGVRSEDPGGNTPAGQWYFNNVSFRFRIGVSRTYGVATFTDFRDVVSTDSVYLSNYIGHFNSNQDALNHAEDQGIEAGDNFYAYTGEDVIYFQNFAVGVDPETIREWVTVPRLDAIPSTPRIFYTTDSILAINSPVSINMNAVLGSTTSGGTISFGDVRVHDYVRHVGTGRTFKVTAKSSYFQSFTVVLDFTDVPPPVVVPYSEFWGEGQTSARETAPVTRGYSARRGSNQYYYRYKWSQEIANVASGLGAGVRAVLRGNYPDMDLIEPSVGGDSINETIDDLRAFLVPAGTYDIKFRDVNNASSDSDMSVFMYEIKSGDDDFLMHDTSGYASAQADPVHETLRGRTVLEFNERFTFDSGVHLTFVAGRFNSTAATNGYSHISFTKVFT